MGFAVFVVYLFLTLLRPAEHIVELRGWALMDVASVLALATAAVGVLMGRGPSFRSVQLPLMVALLAWSAVGVALSPLRSVAAFQAVLGFLKSSGVAFLLVTLSVTSTRRLKVVAATLIMSGLVLATLGIHEYRSIADDVSRAAAGDLETLEPGERQAPRAESDRIFLAGLFGDPNDLALTLVAIVPFCIALRRARAPLRNLALVWAPVALLLAGIYVTRSRGGVVALACVLALSLRHRLGTALSLAGSAVVLVALSALNFLGGRSMEMDQSVEGRIFAWADGLQMLKSSPIWGVGLGMFTEYHPRAAHSAFVGCFAELGFVGYMLWLGLIMITLDDTYYVGSIEGATADSLRRWARAAFVALAGFLVGGLFLSRTYDVLLFILLATGAAVGDLARRSGVKLRSRGVIAWGYLVSAAAGASIICFWAYMRWRS